MALPPQSRQQGERHPLGGARAFRVGLIACLVSIVVATPAVLLADGDLRAAGVALLALGGVALATLVVLRGLEILALRRRGPAHGDAPPTQSNGHGAAPEFRRSRRRD